MLHAKVGRAAQHRLGRRLTRIPCAQYPYPLADSDSDSDVTCGIYWQCIFTFHSPLGHSTFPIKNIAKR